jgi:hypothetical protein
VWLILIISLFFVNWVGLRDRYLTDAYPTQNVDEIAVGDLDVYKPGLEMAYLTPSSVYVVGGLTTGSWQNTSYRNPDWEINPLIAMTVGDFDSNHKGDEIVVLSQNGTLTLILRGTFTWLNVEIGVLPDEPPIWMTNQMFSGQLILTSITEEIAIVGEHFNWSTTTTTGRIYVASRVNSTSWQVEQVFVEPNPLLSGTIGDVDSTNEGEELLAGGIDTGVFYLKFDNGSWTEERILSWLGLTRSIAVGDFMVQHSRNEITAVRDHDIRVFYFQSSEWRAITVWSAPHMQVGMESVLVGDIDPFSPGQEILAVGTVYEGNQPILAVLRYAIVWIPNVLWSFLEPPTSVAVMNVDFTRMGTEILVAESTNTGVLSVPSGLDRIVRAGQAVLLPAAFLLPATILLFGLADYIGRVSEARRRNRSLEMIARGFVKCPKCRRFIPKNKYKAHREWHRTAQFR